MSVRNVIPSDCRGVLDRYRHCRRQVPYGPCDSESRRQVVDHFSEEDRRLFFHCAICGAPLNESNLTGLPNPEPLGYFPWRRVCDECDARAVGPDGEPATSGGLIEISKGVFTSFEGSQNPVWIDGVRCYRRYRFGGHAAFLEDEEHRRLHVCIRRTCVGSLLGLAVGDALGAAVEFKQPGEFPPVTGMRGGGPHGLKPGQWTDDTSMALCLAESLIAKKGFDARDQMERYVTWYRGGHRSCTGKCFDIGNTTRTALEAFERTSEPFSGPRDPETAGNGSLMRLAPVPLFFWKNPARAIDLAAESSRTTHGTQAAVDACRYFAALLVGCCREATKRELLSPRYSPIPRYWEAHPLCPEVDAVAQGSFHLKRTGNLPASGYVVDTLEAALWAFATTDNFKDGCLKAVNLGNDADTTGAVYGQLAGAFYGSREIPASWLETLAFREAIEKLADDPLFDRPEAEYGDACG